MNRQRTNRRRGGTILELALILPIFLMLSLGMLDLGRAVFRYHVLNQAACQGARRAIVHGALADAVKEGGPWGPTKLGPDAMTTAGVPIISGTRDGIARHARRLRSSQTPTLRWTGPKAVAPRPVMPWARR